MKNILLVEPSYKNKYPPMGLMKISMYHKLRGDYILFVKGIDPSVQNRTWDRIYVTTLFTFDFNISIETINFYKSCVPRDSDIFVGGIMASLMKNQVLEKTQLSEKNVVVGLFTDSTVVGDWPSVNIDRLPLDYDILEMVSYQYPTKDSYFAYTTRGCPNRCDFCAVPTLEPKFQTTNNIVHQIKTVNDLYGPKRNLLLLDNNILNASNLPKIIEDLCNVGFKKGALYSDPGDYEVVMRRYHLGERSVYLDKKIANYLAHLQERIPLGKRRDIFDEILMFSEFCNDYAQYMLDVEESLRPLVEKYRKKTKKKRYIDFNQGIDARLLNHENMKLLSKLAIQPLRIAFDSVDLKQLYVRAVRLAHQYGIHKISNYILFNYQDKPEDLYKRLECNIQLNQELGIHIFSFPMKYSPVERTDRMFVGEYWNLKYLHAISAILHVTQGIVAAGASFFYKAFGANLDEYREILAMPRDMIMYRLHYEQTGETGRWRALYQLLPFQDQEELIQFTSRTVTEIKQLEWPEKFKKILPYYTVKFEKSAVDL